LVKVAGMCWVMTVGGQFAGNLVKTCDQGFDSAGGGADCDDLA
jgi:hypothetical protein